MRECFAGTCHQSCEELAKFAVDKNIRHVVCVGTGSSYLAAMSEAYAVKELLGIPAEVYNSTDLRLYCPEYLGEHSLVLINSHSGKSPGDIATVEVAKKKGAYTVAVTDIAHTGLTESVDFVRVGPGGPKVEMPSTRAYAFAMYRIFIFLSIWAKLIGREPVTGDCLAELQALPDFCDAVIDRYDVLGKEIAEKIQGAESFLVMAHGTNISTAQEGAMGLSQASNKPSQGFLLEEYLHGHIQGLPKNVAMVIIGVPGPSQSRMVGFGKVAHALGMDVLTLVPDDNTHLVAYGDAISYPSTTIREIFTPAFTCIPFWFIGYYLTLVKKGDPDLLMANDERFINAHISEYKKEYV